MIWEIEIQTYNLQNTEYNRLFDILFVLFKFFPKTFQATF